MKQIGNNILIHHQEPFDQNSQYQGDEEDQQVLSPQDIQMQQFQGEDGYYDEENNLIMENQQQQMQYQEQGYEMDENQREMFQYEQNQNSSQEEYVQDEEEEEEEEDLYMQEELDIIQLKQLIEDDGEKFQDKVRDMNDLAALKLNAGQQRESLVLLQQAEKILEYAASSGKIIDRNLIIIILYNLSCCYQSLWILDKCSKYIDGVVFNIELSLKEEKQEISKKKLKTQDKDILAYQVKRQIFLVKSYLQYCAILSQLGQHDTAKNIAKKGISNLQDVFQNSFAFVNEVLKSNTSTASSANTQQDQKNNNNNESSTLLQTNYGKKYITQKKVVQDANNNPILTQQVQEDVFFSKLVYDNAFSVLRDIVSISQEVDFNKNAKQFYKEASQSLYYWKNTPENNERHLRQELNAPQKNKNEEIRSILGVSNGNEWIEGFNIGSIMHMSPISYDDFTFFGDIVYELSNKMLLEKIIYLSICYFTVATEIRFQELDKVKKNEAKEQRMKQKLNSDNINSKDKDKLKEGSEDVSPTLGTNKEQKVGSTTQIETEEYKNSELYHLKAIEIVCKHITCKSPYINHLVTSYHKHYNQNLDIIDEEESFLSGNNSPAAQIQGKKKFQFDKKLDENMNQFQDIQEPVYEIDNNQEFLNQNQDQNWKSGSAIFENQNVQQSLQQDNQHIHNKQQQQKQENFYLSINNNNNQQQQNLVQQQISTPHPKKSNVKSTKKTKKNNLSNKNTPKSKQISQKLFSQNTNSQQNQINQQIIQQQHQQQQQQSYIQYLATQQIKNSQNNQNQKHVTQTFQQFKKQQALNKPNSPSPRQAQVQARTFQKDDKLNSLQNIDNKQKLKLNYLKCEESLSQEQSMNNSDKQQAIFRKPSPSPQFQVHNSLKQNIQPKKQTNQQQQQKINQMRRISSDRQLNKPKGKIQQSGILFKSNNPSTHNSNQKITKLMKNNNNIYKEDIMKMGSLQQRQQSVENDNQTNSSSQNQLNSSDNNQQQQQSYENSENQGSRKNSKSQQIQRNLKSQKVNNYNNNNQENLQLHNFLKKPQTANPNSGNNVQQQNFTSQQTLNTVGSVNDDKILKEIKQQLQKQDLNKNTWSMLRNLEKNQITNNNITPKRNNFTSNIQQNNYNILNNQSDIMSNSKGMNQNSNYNTVLSNSSLYTQNGGSKKVNTERAESRKVIYESSYNNKTERANNQKKLKKQPQQNQQQQQQQKQQDTSNSLSSLLKPIAQNSDQFQKIIQSANNNNNENNNNKIQQLQLQEKLQQYQQNEEQDNSNDDFLDIQLDQFGNVIGDPMSTDRYR